MRNRKNNTNYIGDVVCAIIEQDEHFLIAQRPPGHPHENKWEFPGGKVRKGESNKNAIEREIVEELNLVVEVGSPLTPNYHAYEHVSLTLAPFLCSVVKGTPEPLEHSSIAWVDELTVKTYEFAEADIPILQEYLLRRSSK